MIDWLTVESIITAYRHQKLDYLSLSLEKNKQILIFNIGDDRITVKLVPISGNLETLLYAYPLDKFDRDTERKIEELLK